MSREDDLYSGQRAADQAYNARSAPRRSVMVGNEYIDATPYIGMRYPGEDVTKMLGDPKCILKNPKPGAVYVWRKPGNAKTVGGVRRGWLRPVLIDEINLDSPYSDVETRRVPTKSGPAEVVENIGLGLFEMPSAEAEKQFNAWDSFYIAGLVELTDTWQGDVERLSHSSMTATASAYPISAEDSKREAI